MAERGLGHVSDGFAETLRGQPIGSPDSPEAGFTASRPVRETLRQTAREGLDPLMGAGFERATHEMAAEQYLRERGHGVGRDHDSQGPERA